ncbi:predicted protein [Histoplasma mississippiense (nom. inval.)]|uniref:predicted protein n=1 Tax=Ajellomyces capsulatus (strain NAm1 / WU24) TaxID=2059318 RepID=UPI000157C3E1|nr:predicted protein [Histoplasma mississippiense (nom. inval.)]EDN07519.1 predicted protein [Histoplasma mississippiense (nom. inval.)]
MATGASRIPQCQYLAGNMNTIRKHWAEQAQLVAISQPWPYSATKAYGSTG